MRPGGTLDLRAGCQYEVLRSLGRGAMAEVFLARRVKARGFSREVALKCVTAMNEPDEEVRRSFPYEARLASYLHHPGIAEAYDVEEIGGRLYLVLEYVDGLSARTIVRRAKERQRPLSLGFSCYVAASIAEALHYAHELKGPSGAPLGIVHRDVSAKNVMVTRTGIPKLLDFGIALAKMTGRGRTATGKVLGTVEYMSPEQVSGGPVDGRSDLFSLGVFLVELLSGSRVFDGPTEVVTAQSIARCDPGRVREATRVLPPSLEKICRRLLARRVKDRFQNGGELARALRGFMAERGIDFGAAECAAELAGLDGTAAVAPLPATTARPVIRAGRPRRRVWAMGAAAAAGLALVTGVASWTRSHRPPAELGSEAPGVDDHHAVSAQEGRAEGPQALDLSPGAQQQSVPGRSAKGGDPSAAVEAVSPPTGRRSAKTVQPEEMANVVPLVPRKRAAPGSTSHQARAVPTIAEASPPRSEPPGGVRPAGGEMGARASGASAGSGVFMNFADRPVVHSASATLAKGTLLHASLVGTIDARKGGVVEAVLTEDASSGELVIPRGSTVRCRAGSVAEDRISVTCGQAKDGSREWLFSGIAVGQGQRTGLEVVDYAVPAGTPFVVYVTASAVVD